jgi:putative ABC transport system permease protein
VAVISGSLARKYWPDEDPLGRRLRTAPNEPWITVVGVADDVIHDWFNRRNYPTLYRPMRQSPAGSLGLAVRATVDPVSISTASRAAVRAVDPSQPVFEVLTMRRLLEERTLGLQYLGGIMLVFGLIALILAAVGVYGVIANMVAQRTQEIGVRMALGATSGDVVRMTIRETSTLIGAGVGIGLILSVAVSRLVERGLLGLTRGDAGLTVAIAGTLIVVALAAAYIPARRAAAIDPSVALRAE